MLMWLRYIGPGLALIFGGSAVATVLRMQDVGTGMVAVGFVYLFIVAPIYKRRWRAERKARDWHLLREAKKKYQ
jgi:membrane protein implicated in regulation of membrane protease activity